MIQCESCKINLADITINDRISNVNYHWCNFCIGCIISGIMPQLFSTIKFSENQYICDSCKERISNITLEIQSYNVNYHWCGFCAAIIAGTAFSQLQLTKSEFGDSQVEILEKIRNFVEQEPEDIIQQVIEKTRN